jgi:hypothetical protein
LKTHGMSNAKLYRKWSAMRQRCLNPNDKEFKNYGGRGIKVCPQWLNFIVFAKWAKESGYKDGLTLERIDVNGDYCPENCTWATLKQQMNNKRNNVIIKTESGFMTLAEFSRKRGLSYSTVQMRLRRGIDLNKPLNYDHRQVIRDDGKVYATIAQAAKENGVVESRIRAVCNGERKRTAGHAFSYFTREEAEKALEVGKP